MIKGTIINLDSRPERLKEFITQELPPINFKRMRATIGGMAGCTDSHLRAMRNFDIDGINGIFEDDCKFQNLHLFDKVISELPSDWDALYLGGQIECKDVELFREHLVSVKSLFATHGILYNGTKVSSYVLQNWTTTRIHKHYRSVDTFMVNEVQPRFKVFCANPLLAIQRDNYSDTTRKQRVYKWG